MPKTPKYQTNDPDEIPYVSDDAYMAQGSEDLVVGHVKPARGGRTVRDLFKDLRIRTAPSRPYRTGYWRTVDDRELALSEMDLDHLHNARAMLCFCVARGRGSSGCGVRSIESAICKIQEITAEMSRR